ncbi:MAG TPA: hypothetical protein PKJ75_06895, partial [Methanosarcina vacuolata]|nr:hypothetical protein [Methanosarcina vacuolata]
METKQHTLTKEEVRSQYNNLIGKKVFFIFFLLFAIILVSGISASMGSANLSIWETYSSILNKLFPAYFETG